MAAGDGCRATRFDTARESGPLLARSAALIAELVREDIDSGQFRQVDPALAAWFLLAVFNTVDMGMVSLGHVPADEEIEGIVDLALDGIKRR